MVHVPDVQLELLLPGQGVPPVHLGPPRDPRDAPRASAPASPSSDPGTRISSGRGPTRLMSPLQHVHELGQLVETGRPKEGTRSASGARRPMSLAIRSDAPHRSELQDRERAPVQTRAFLTEEHRRTQRAPNDDRHRGDHRREHDEPYGSPRDIDDPLQDRVGPARAPSRQHFAIELQISRRHALDGELIEAPLPRGVAHRVARDTVDEEVHQRVGKGSLLAPRHEPARLDRRSRPRRRPRRRTRRTACQASPTRSTRRASPPCRRAGSRRAAHRPSRGGPAHPCEHPACAPGPAGRGRTPRPPCGSASVRPPAPRRPRPEAAEGLRPPREGEPEDPSPTSARPSTRTTGAPLSMPSSLRVTEGSA